MTDSNGIPVSGATVTATRSGGGVYTATTNANGIYAIVKVPSSSSYNVIPTKPGLSFPSKSVSTGFSANGTIYSGNVMGVDFVPGVTPPLPLPPLTMPWTIMRSSSAPAAALTGLKNSPIIITAAAPPRAGRSHLAKPAACKPSCPAPGPCLSIGPPLLIHFCRPLINSFSTSMA